LLPKPQNPKINIMNFNLTKLNNFKYVRFIIK